MYESELSYAVNSRSWLAGPLLVAWNKVNTIAVMERVINAIDPILSKGCSNPDSEVWTMPKRTPIFK